MNIFFKYLSLSILLLSLFAVTHNQCMHIKNLTIKSIAIKPKYYSSKKTDNPLKTPNDKLYDFCKFPRTIKSKKNERIMRKMPFKVLLKLVKSHQEHEKYESRQARCTFRENQDFVNELKSLCLEKSKLHNDNAETLTYNNTCKALMCLPDPKQKKKRLLQDELKYPHGQDMGGDKLAYKITGKELLNAIPKLEELHKELDDLHKKIYGHKN